MRQAPKNPSNSSCIYLNTQDVFVRYFVFGIDGNSQGFDGFLVRFFYYCDSFLDANTILPLPKIESQKKRPAYHANDLEIVLQRIVHQRSRGTVWEERWYRPEEALHHVQERIPHPEREQNRKQAHVD